MGENPASDGAVTENQARAVTKEIEQLCQEHGLYYVKSMEYKGSLAMIRFQEISLKVDQPRDR
jgi:hypothetical protein